MNITLRHVVWGPGMIAGAFIGVFVAPAWEFAPILVGFVASITAGMSAQLVVIKGPVGVIAGALATCLGFAVMLMLARDNPPWVVERCAGAVVLSGVIGAALGLGIRRFLDQR